jgi:hypothetical protein
MLLTFYYFYINRFMVVSVLVYCILRQSYKQREKRCILHENTMNVIYLYTDVPRRVDKTSEACSVFQLEQKVSINYSSIRNRYRVKRAGLVKNRSVSVASSKLDRVVCWSVDMTFDLSAPVNLFWCDCVLLLINVTGNMPNVYA